MSLQFIHAAHQTGLCVYEIDDPALRLAIFFVQYMMPGPNTECDFFCVSRDDPSVDESTRLRNRIAELESLVRELRGAPFFVNLTKHLIRNSFSLSYASCFSRQTAPPLGRHELPRRRSEREVAFTRNEMCAAAEAE